MESHIMLYRHHIEKIKRALLITILLMMVIMGVYIWLHNTRGTKVKAVQVEHVDDSADVIVTDVELTEMINDRLLWTLEAKEAKVYNTDTRKEIRGKDVEVDFYDERGQKSMHLVSDRGRKDNETGNVIASGNVRATSLVDRITLKTSKLIYDARLNKIVSDEHVIIEREGVITSGDGLESNLSLTEAKILRNVTTSFVTDAAE